MIAEADLNPIDPRAKDAVIRLRAFHRIVATHSDRHFRTLVINDGAVVYRDLSLRDDGVTHDFLQRSHRLFEAIAGSEARNGWSGARMVLCAGFRARGSGRAIDAAEARVRLILARLDAGEMQPEEAVREAASIQRYSDTIPQLQANFAFTRAYVADAAGSRAGLGGARMFVDTSIFMRGQPPPWVKHEAPIPFKDGRLGFDCVLVPVNGLQAPGKVGQRIPGLRTGLEIGEAIAPTMALRDQIRASHGRKQHNRTDRSEL